MSKDLLWEIGLEEMPSAFFPKLTDDLYALAVKKLTDNKLNFAELKVWATPRRLVIFVSDLAEKQPDSIIENRGPKKKVAFDDKGEPTKAILGFARGQGVNINMLEVKEVNGEEYMFAVKNVPGEFTEQIATRILLEIFNELPLPKSMRWGYAKTRFIRPIRWLLVLYGEQYLDMQIENIYSSNVTYGHRFLSKGALEVKSITDYFAILKQHYVVIDQNERQSMIAEQIEDIALQAGGKPLSEPGILNENTYLVEYPHAFYGSFSPEYLKIPIEVLTTSMITNQRYFPLFNKKGDLLPGFIAVKNGTDLAIDNVRSGNERVLKARLEDALFFWQEDTAKKLEEFVPALEKVMFHEKLGNVLEKVKRLEALALYLGEKLRLSEPTILQRAAYLCKADLQTNMVYEFGELQGIMGAYYAVHSGESREVADAIREHYQPRFAGDDLPTSQAGIILSLSEKIDNLTGFFAIGIKPTGSQDPYALRRQALGIVNIILAADIRLDLSAVLAFAYGQYRGYQLELTEEQTIQEIIKFISLRLRGLWLEQGVRYDLADAVLAAKVTDLQDLQVRLRAISKFIATDHLDDFMVVYNRAHNLTKKWFSDKCDVTYLLDPTEIKLFAEIEKSTALITEKNRQADYEASLEVLAKLRPTVDNFFDSVMVMVDDENLKATRLGLLKKIDNLAQNIADFSLLQI